MTYETLRIDRDEGVATVFLNRPEKLNALNATVRRELIEAVDSLVADGARAIVLTGSGDRAFAAGADVAEFAERTPDEQRRTMSKRRIYDAVSECPVPTIAAVQGYCFGGGCELALACDLRVADRTARFGQLEIRLGLIPGGGGTQRLTRLVGPGQALRLSLTGDTIDGEEAFRIGLVEVLVDDGDHLFEARKIARRMARWSAGSLALVKQAVRAALEQPLSQGLETERDLFIEAFASDDAKAGIRAFLEARSAGTAKQ